MLKEKVKIKLNEYFSSTHTKEINQAAQDFISIKELENYFFFLKPIFNEVFDLNLKLLIRNRNSTKLKELVSVFEKHQIGKKIMVEYKIFENFRITKDLKNFYQCSLDLDSK